jgi:hypothetical protein
MYFLKKYSTEFYIMLFLIWVIVIYLGGNYPSKLMLLINILLTIVLLFFSVKKMYSIFKSY